MLPIRVLLKADCPHPCAWPHSHDPKPLPKHPSPFTGPLAFSAADSQDHPPASAALRVSNGIIQ